LRERERKRERERERKREREKEKEGEKESGRKGDDDISDSPIPSKKLPGEKQISALRQEYPSSFDPEIAASISFSRIK
jgi:hypothetical protein